VSRRIFACGLLWLFVVVVTLYGLFYFHVINKSKRRPAAFQTGHTDIMEPGQRSQYCDEVNGLDGSGFESGQGQEFSRFSKTSRRVLGPLSLIFNGYRGLFSPPIKRSGREVD
jgi:hypothetical protein